MLQSIELMGIRLKRDDTLADPKSIFNYLWTEFCRKAEKDLLPPTLFFIRPELIEVFNFGPFTENDRLKHMLVTMIKARVSQEQDIEGVAMCFEGYMRFAKPGMPQEEIFKKPSTCPDSKDCVLLSFCWRGVEKTFMRAAEKTTVESGYHLAELTDMNEAMGGGTFSNFFSECEKKPQKEFFA